MKRSSPIRLLVLALCGWLICAASRAPAAPPAPDPGPKLSQYVHDVWNVEDGLPSIVVWDVLRTRDGYLWLATGEGLVRFDGVRFETFNVENTPVFETDRFGHLAEGPDGSLWIGSRGGGLYRYRQGRFTAFPGATPAGSDVHALLVDRSGEVWAGTRDGLYRLHQDRLVAEEAPELAAAAVSALFEDSEGALWIGTYERGALRRHHDRYEAITSEDGLSSDLVSAVYRDSAGTLWIATYDGLNQLREGWRQDGRITVYRKAQGLAHDTVLALDGDAAGSLWIGTYDGLSRWRDGRFDNFTLRTSTKERPARPFTAVVTHVDREGNLWVGSYGNGLHRFKAGPVLAYTTAEGLAENAVMAVFEDRAGSLLIGTTGGGIDRLRGDVVETLFPAADTPFSNIWSMLEDRAGRLWIGTKNGLAHYDGTSFRLYTTADGLAHDEVRVVIEDPRQAATLWIGTYGGVSRLQGGVFTTIDSTDGLSSDRVRSLCKDRAGALWIGTEVGLNRLRDAQLEGGKIEVFTTEHGLSSNQIRPFYEDGEGTLWIGTAGGGLMRYKGGTFTTYTKRDGLPQSDVWAIVEDDDQNLWWSSDQGIIRVRKADFEAYDQGRLAAVPARTYGLADGMKDMEGNGHGHPAAWKTTDGMLWFTTVAGLVRLDPRQRNTLAPPVVIESLLADGAPVDLAAAIRLPAERRDIEIRYTSLSLRDPDRVRFEVRLEGYDDAWQEVGGRRVAYYTNVPTGDHTFRVRAANEDGVWNEAGAAITLTVLAPLWRTWWAYSLYTLLLAAVLAGFVKAQRHKLAREVEHERRVVRRLREVDRLKDEFLANTSHELRTPLYGITGLAESLIDGATGELAEQTEANLSMIVSSGRRLSRLVDDILDHSRLTHGSLKLEKQAVDLYPLADVVLTLSRPLVGSKELQLVNQVAGDLPPAHADESRLEQILYNLIGNAVKFTEEGQVGISARVEDARLVVTVEDTGIGIAASARERIFDAFEQADSGTVRAFGGTGLGLAVTRQLVELHGGRIWVESTVGEGASFHFTLPVSSEQAVEVDASTAPVSRLRENPVAVADPLSSPPRAAESSPSGATGRILAVDDEPVVLQVLSNHLASGGYEVTRATSGPQSLELLGKGTFDLVLLDVMMPRMSGYEVCRTLRERHTREELPVIFLTAKNQVADLVTGLAAGGNDYLAKPISKDELLARVRTHLGLLQVHRNREVSNAELARFNYTVSHDLRNQLTTITNFVGLARRDAAKGDAERLEKDFDRLEGASAKLKQLIDDLFEFSSVGVQDNRPEEMAFGELVREAREKLAAPITKRSAEVVVASDLPTVYGDRQWLSEIPRELLENAVKHLGDQRRPRVEIGAREEGCGTVFYVRDNGQGIDPRYHETIFGLFERLSPEESEGTGVGLPLVRRIVELHGGRIWVESQGLGFGSTFCFTLPPTSGH